MKNKDIMNKINHINSIIDGESELIDLEGNKMFIDDDFIDWFTISGSSEKCIDRLSTLIDLGLDHIYLLGGSPIAEPREARLRAMVDQTEIFANEVLPHFK